jgi:hypothetical protein
MAFYMDGRYRTYGTEILTGATTDAGLFVNGGHGGRQVVVGVARNHLDGLCGAVAGAVAALSFAEGGDTMVGRDHGVADLYA